MKTLHTIPSNKRPVSDWVVAWIWWIQNNWVGYTDIIYNERGVSFTSPRGLRGHRREINYTVMSHWSEANKPGPDWTKAIYENPS